jgi:NADH-quinone oxidoreductase subunit C
VPDGEQAIGLLRDKFPDSVVDAGSYRDQHWAELKADRLIEICEWLRDDPATAFDYLVDVTAVHWPDDPEPIELVYHLQSYARNDRLRLKVRTGDTGPIPTLSDVWRAADWNEREAYDMFGVRFEGHPDLRRILMPDDYTDFPLRKEFPLYRG